MIPEDSFDLLHLQENGLGWAARGAVCRVMRGGGGC